MGGLTATLFVVERMLLDFISHIPYTKVFETLFPK